MIELKLIDNYWTDIERNNKWSYNYFTKEQAMKEAKTQDNCNDMVDCSCLIDCYGLNNCYKLIDCTRLRNCYRVNNCYDLRNCFNISNCSWLSHCSGIIDCLWLKNCSGLRESPQLYKTPLIGSRYSQTYFYYWNKGHVIICGCFSGEIDNFELQVKNKYTEDNKHYKDYMKEISVFRFLLNNISKE